MRNYLQAVQLSRTAAIYRLRQIELGVYTPQWPDTSSGLCYQLFDWLSWHGLPWWRCRCPRELLLRSVMIAFPYECGTPCHTIPTLMGACCAEFSWPYFSGDCVYPLPGGYEAYEQQVEDGTLWKGDGLVLRRHLAGFIADLLEREEI